MVSGTEKNTTDLSDLLYFKKLFAVIKNIPARDIFNCYFLIKYLVNAKICIIDKYIPIIYFNIKIIFF